MVQSHSQVCFQMSAESNQGVCFLIVVARAFHSLGAVFEKAQKLNCFLLLFFDSAALGIHRR